MPPKQRGETALNTYIDAFDSILKTVKAKKYSKRQEELVDKIRVYAENKNIDLKSAYKFYSTKHKKLFKKLVKLRNKDLSHENPTWLYGGCISTDEVWLFVDWLFMIGDIRDFDLTNKKITELMKRRFKKYHQYQKVGDFYNLIGNKTDIFYCLEEAAK